MDRSCLVFVCVYGHPWKAHYETFKNSAFNCFKCMYPAAWDQHSLYWLHVLDFGAKEFFCPGCYSTNVQWPGSLWASTPPQRLHVQARRLSITQRWPLQFQGQVIESSNQTLQLLCGLKACLLNATVSWRAGAIWLKDISRYNLIILIDIDNYW